MHYLGFDRNWIASGRSRDGLAPFPGFPYQVDEFRVDVNRLSGSPYRSSVAHVPLVMNRGSAFYTEICRQGHQQSLKAQADPKYLVRSLGLQRSLTIHFLELVGAVQENQTRCSPNRQTRRGCVYSHS